MQDHNGAFLYGMQIQETLILNPPDFSDVEHFTLDSPILLKKKRPNDGYDFVTFEQAELASELLTKSLHRKIELAGLPEEYNDIKLSFDTEYPGSKTKLIRIKGIENRTSMCPIVAKGNKESKAFLWSVGAGNGTGVGFGAIR